MGKDTKGKWKLKQNDLGLIYIEDSLDKGLVISSTKPKYIVGLMLHQANLIAKLPRMYELLKQLADWDAGKFGKESNIKIIEISKQASQLIETLKEDYNA